MEYCKKYEVLLPFHKQMSNRHSCRIAWTLVHFGSKYPYTLSLKHSQRENNRIDIPQNVSAVLLGIWWPNFHIIEKAMVKPTGDVAAEQTRAELLRGSFLLFALELALSTHPHIHSLSAFFTLLHQSVPKLFPHFGEFPRLIPWHKWMLGLITLAWTHRVCPVPAKHARLRAVYLSIWNVLAAHAVFANTLVFVQEWRN